LAWRPRDRFLYGDPPARHRKTPECPNPTKPQPPRSNPRQRRKPPPSCSPPSADIYRQEIGAEEDAHRALPFFGTALGIVIGALAYAAGRLPKWPDLAMDRGLIAFATADVLPGLAVVEAGCVLIWDLAGHRPAQI
jgi:hypothetical protein